MALHPLCTLLLLTVAVFIAQYRAVNVITTQTVVKVIEDPYINGTTYHGHAKAAVNYADTWSVCPAWSNFITATDFTADVSFDPDGHENIDIDLATLAGPNLHSDFGFVGINFYNSAQTLCSGFYCLIVYGPKQTVRLQIAGYEKKKTFNLTMPPHTFRKLFHRGGDGSTGTINWRFIQC